MSTSERRRQCRAYYRAHRPRIVDQCIAWVPWAEFYG
jgi:hypothetical protein